MTDVVLWRSESVYPVTAVLTSKTIHDIPGQPIYLPHLLRKCLARPERSLNSFGGLFVIAFAGAVIFFGNTTLWMSKVELRDWQVPPPACWLTPAATAGWGGAFLYALGPCAPLTPDAPTGEGDLVLGSHVLMPLRPVKKWIEFLFFKIRLLLLWN